MITSSTRSVSTWAISRREWRTNLVLDIDHIVEWIFGTDGSTRFRVAPTTLVFHDVTNLRIMLDFKEGDGARNINEPSIAAITREQATKDETPAKQAYWTWRIALNLPKDGEIVFGATGYTQSLRAKPKLVEEPRLPAKQRA